MNNFSRGQTEMSVMQESPFVFGNCAMHCFTYCIPAVVIGLTDPLMKYAGWPAG